MHIFDREREDGTSVRCGSICTGRCGRLGGKCYDKQYVGDYLASHGYVVLAVDALFWGERGRKEGVRYDSQQALAANMLQMGMSWGALIAWDDIRSAEFLASLPMVHKDKIGTMGFPWEHIVPGWSVPLQMW